MGRAAVRLNNALHDPATSGRLRGAWFERADRVDCGPSAFVCSDSESGCLFNSSATSATRPPISHMPPSSAHPKPDVRGATNALERQPLLLRHAAQLVLAALRAASTILQKHVGHFPAFLRLKAALPAACGQPPRPRSGTGTASSQRRDAAGGVAASRAEDKAVAPHAQRRRPPRAQDCRPAGKERGESASGSARKRRALRSAQRGTERVLRAFRSFSGRPYSTYASDRHRKAETPPAARCSLPAQTGWRNRARCGVARRRVTIGLNYVRFEHPLDSKFPAYVKFPFGVAWPIVVTKRPAPALFRS